MNRDELALLLCVVFGAVMVLRAVTTRGESE